MDSFLWLIGEAVFHMLPVGICCSVVRKMGGILSMQPGSMLSFAICMVIAIVVPFVLTVIMGSRKGIAAAAGQAGAAKNAARSGDVLAAGAGEGSADQSADETGAKEMADVKELTAFLSGKVISIEDVPDQVFSTRTLGDGLAIEPTDSTLVAPADGEISVVMEGSNHAVGMTLGGGIEVLMHIGLDTVEMNGSGFTLHVREGQLVKAGEKLITFDPEKIRAAGHPVTTMLVITEDNGRSLTFQTGKKVTAGQDVIADIE